MKRRAENFRNTIRNNFSPNQKKEVHASSGRTSLSRECLSRLDSTLNSNIYFKKLEKICPNMETLKDSKLVINHVAQSTILGDFLAFGSKELP